MEKNETNGHRDEDRAKMDVRLAEIDREFEEVFGNAR